MQPQFLHYLVVICTYRAELRMKIGQLGVVIHQRLVHFQHLERLSEEVRLEENRPCIDTRFSEHGEETVVFLLIETDGDFRIKIDDIIHYIGLPTKDEVKNRNYDEAIIRPFNKAVEEIESISNGSIHMDFDYDDINTFLAGRMNVGIDQTLWDYIQKLDKTRAAKQLKGKTSHKKAPKVED